MTRRQFRLTDLDLDEISQVVSGDDPTAHILIVKTAPCGCDIHTGTERNKKGEQVCERCGGMISKGMPSGDSMHIDAPLSDEFKHKDKMRKRKKTTRKSREKAMEAIDNMSKNDTPRSNRIR
jgi:hypothetical protein